jgi:hypothetical protein
MLDGLASCHRFEIGESELDAISKDVLPFSDSEPESCASGMAARHRSRTAAHVGRPPPQP